MGCISYTTFFTSSQPMGMPGGMPNMGAGAPMGPLPPLTEADIAELENLYQSLTANMSQEEKDMLQKMGEDLMNQYAGPQTAPQKIDQKTQPAQQKPTLPPLRPETPTKTPEMLSIPQLTPQQERHIQEELDTFINNLSNLQTMIEASADFASALRDFRLEINDLLYSVKVINKPEHHVRLNTPEFSRLLKTIEHLNNAFKLKAFSDACSQTEGCKIADLEDPFATLGISPSATQKDIDAAFKKQQKKFENAKKQAKRKGLTAAEQERSLRAAHYSFDLVSNAYDLIKDPKMRAILEKERKAQRAAEQSMHQSIHTLLGVINQELYTAIFNNQLITDIDQFFKKYEPTQLEIRKKMEQAEAARLKEHEEELKRKAGAKVQIVSKERETGWPWYQPSSYPSYGPGGYYPSAGPSYGTPNIPTPSSGLPQQATDQGKPGQYIKPGDKEKAALPQTEAEKKAAEEAKKKQQTSLPQAQLAADATTYEIYQLDKTFKKFNDVFDREYFENIILPMSEKTKEQAQERITTIYTENKPSPEDILETLQTIKTTITDANADQKYTYQLAWKNQQNREPFMKNLQSLKKVLDPLKEEITQKIKRSSPTKKGAEGETQEQRAEEPAEILQTTVKDLTATLDALNEQFKTSSQNQREPKKQSFANNRRGRK